ncbi:MAG TPA: beta-galactosidase trimerization domain-containing protein [bacterium]|nr:beta-galactosidase trimerization domain-containing protein [bacterium]HOL34576.1 beta-galactosidase trimerization domain-containing protein [bacterium]HPP07619.1 beta-galactosidase trimerization domain-containing protein [bacterium]
MKKLLFSIMVFLCIFSLTSQAQQKKNPEKIYVRFKMLSADQVYAYLKTVIHHSPWSKNYPTIPRGGENYARLRIKQNNFSPWVEIDGDWGTIVFDFKSSQILENVEVEIQLSTKDDESGIFKTMKIQEKGSIVAISLPSDYYNNPDGILTVRQESEKHLKMAQSLNLSRENLPKKFSFYTGAGGYGSLYTDVEIWKNELKTLRTLGINGTSYPWNAEQNNIYKELGFDRFVTYNPGNPDQAKKEKELSEETFSKIQAVVIADEPGNYGLYQIKNEPVENFHRFLESKGLKPKDFNAKDWSDIKPLTDKKEIEKIEYNWGPKYGEAARKTYYWTIRYTEHMTNQYFKNITNSHEKQYQPGVLTFVNYTDHPMILGGMMLPGSPDWFEMGLQRATTLMWTEDWMYGGIRSWGNGLYQRLGFLCDILRNAASKHNQPLGFYNTMDGEDGIRMKGFIVIGHGVKIIDYFYYGPTYSATENYWSDSISQYQGVAKVIRDIGKAEELVYPGQVPKRDVAIIYSTTEEIWDQNGAKGHEKQYLHIALAQQMYHADVLNEDLILERDLSQYRVIYFTDTRFPIAGLKKLKTYVENGGTLVMMPGAGEKDEYDNNVNVITSLLGTDIKTISIEKPEKTSIILNTSTGIQSDIPVIVSFKKAEVLGAVKDQILGKFLDGSPAILSSKVKKGRIIYYMFMPGHNFFSQVQEANPEGYVKNFPEHAKKIISFPCEMSGIKKQIEISEGTFDANLLISEKGVALVLVNLGRDPIASANFKVQAQGIKSVTSIENGNLQFKEENGYVYFSMPVNGLTDIVMLKK